MPANDRGTKLETLRNAPSLLDVAARGPYPWDGAYDTLDAYLAHKLTSEHMGWRPGEADRAKSEIHALLLNDDGSDPLAGGTYAEQFEAVKNLDVASLSADDAFSAVIASLQDYLATAVTRNTAAYDAFMYLNRFPEGLAGEGDTPQDYSGRLFGRVANEEGRVLIRFPNIYNEEAYQGWKTFMRVIPTWNSSVVGEEKNIGNCVACHIPPKFTDYTFHNIGVAQFEYDAAHGEGAFAKLNPAAPSEKTHARADASDPDKADLGRWNVDPMEENFGAFKTPKLRDPAGSDPYMHNGRYASIEDAIRLHIQAAELGRQGRLRNADPELLKISGLTDKDIQQLVAFFATLNEVEPDEYRDYRITNVRIRQDPMGEATFSN
jgi:cytochrome c peroxidase